MANWILIWQCSAAETMLDRSGIGSEVVAQNSVPDDPYQSIEGAEHARSAPHNSPQRVNY